MRARILIEGEAIALAATRMSPRQVSVIESMLGEWDEMRALKHKKDVDREVTLNQSFHFEIYRACGSAVLIPMIESLWLQSGPCHPRGDLRLLRGRRGRYGPFPPQYRRGSFGSGCHGGSRARWSPTSAGLFNFLRNKLQSEAASKGTSMSMLAIRITEPRSALSVTAVLPSTARAPDNVEFLWTYLAEPLIVPGIHTMWGRGPVLLPDPTGPSSSAANGQTHLPSGRNATLMPQPGDIVLSYVPARV